MNTYTVFGIAVIAVGSVVTLVTKRWVYRIGGILLSAVGTFLLVYGSYQSDAEARRATEEQFRTLSAKMDSIQVLAAEQTGGDTVSAVALPAPSDTASAMREAVAEVTEEFRAWARQFRQNVDVERLRHKRALLDAELDEIQRTERWGQAYAYFFESIKKALEAMKREGFTGIAYSIPPLPKNLYRSGTAWAGWVRCSSSTGWSMRFSVGFDGRFSNLLLRAADSLQMIRATNGEYLWELQDYVTLSADERFRKLLISASGSLRTPFADLPYRTPISDFRPVVDQLVQRMLETSVVGR